MEEEERGTISQERAPRNHPHGAAQGPSPSQADNMSMDFKHPVDANGILPPSNLPRSPKSRLSKGKPLDNSTSDESGGCHKSPVSVVGISVGPLGSQRPAITEIIGWNTVC